MKDALLRWVAFWDRREPPTTLALLRLLISSILLADLLIIICDGQIQNVFAPPPFGVAYGALSQDPPLVTQLWGATAAAGERVFWIALVAIVFFLLGAFTRIAGITFVIASAQLSLLAPDSSRGIDALLRIAVAILALSGTHARWSVDAWIRRKIGRPFPELVPAWPRYLLFAQLLWMYFSAATAKGDPAWGPLGGFSALSRILCDPHFGRFSAEWVSFAFPLLHVATALTMAFEWGAPLLILFHYWHVTRREPGRLRALSNRLQLRYAYIALGASFHLGIAFTMRLGIFPWGMLAMYPAFFHPRELSAAWNAVRARGLH